MKDVGKFDVKVSAIPNGLEKYMAFTVNKNLVFIDSMQFMNSSLDSLVKNLSDNDFIYLSEEFSGEFLKLVKQKGFKKFFEDKLPDRSNFFSSLKDECISEKDYLKAVDIWSVFKINTTGDYHDLYLKADVLLLADAFEKFIKICMDYCGLDRCHYFSSPGLRWDAMLKMTGIELELISNIDMHLFIEKGMRGGISYIAKRHNKANNKYMKGHDTKKPSKFITYLDANIYYCSAMIQYISYGGFEWLNQKEISDFCLSSVGENSSIGCMLEVEPEYPGELHDLHNDYPLAPKKLEISQNVLSNYCFDIANEYGIKIGSVNKLVPNLGIKSKYVVYYKNLQLYLSLGMKLNKIHRILKFKQSNWLKKYIDFSTDKRKCS